MTAVTKAAHMLRARACRRRAKMARKLQDSYQTAIDAVAAATARTADAAATGTRPAALLAIESGAPMGAKVATASLSEQLRAVEPQRSAPAAAAAASTALQTVRNEPSPNPYVGCAAAVAMVAAAVCARMHRSAAA